MFAELNKLNISLQGPR